MNKLKKIIGYTIITFFIAILLFAVAFMIVNNFKMFSIQMLVLFTILLVFRLAIYLID